MQKINIRHADLNDVPFLVSSAVAMARETEDLSLDETVVREGILGILENPRFGFYLVAEMNGSPVGTAMITYEWSDWRAALFWWLQSVYVIPKLRGTGVFRAMLAYLEEKMQNTNRVAGMRLYVEKENHTAMRIYRRVGFKDTKYLLLEKEKPC